MGRSKATRSPRAMAHAATMPMPLPTTGWTTNMGARPLLSLALASEVAAATVAAIATAAAAARISGCSCGYGVAE
eukprot:354463-Chlamydomonas_euryale.AAC.3